MMELIEQIQRAIQVGYRVTFGGMEPNLIVVTLTENEGNTYIQQALSDEDIAIANLDVPGETIRMMLRKLGFTS